jgi:hypothetical protein
MALVAVAAVALVGLRRGRVVGIVVVLVGVAGLASLGAFSNVSQLRDASFQEGSVQATGEYRIEIFEVASRAENFSLLGKPIPEDQDALGFNTSISAQTGLRSIDSSYALTYLAFGALTAIAFVGTCFLLASAAFRTRLSLINRAWAAAILGVLVNFVSANLIAQFTHIFWIGAGIVAAALQASKERAETPAPDVPVAALVS